MIIYNNKKKKTKKKNHKSHFLEFMGVVLKHSPTFTKLLHKNYLHLNLRILGILIQKKI